MSTMPPDEQPQTRTRLPVGDQDGAPPRRSLRTLAVAVGVVAALVVVLAVVNRTGGAPAGASAGTGGGSSADGSSAAPTAPTGTVPVTTTNNNVATGFPRSAEGAQSAAVNYSVALGSSEMYAADSRHKVVSTVTDPAVTADLQGRFDQSYDAQAKALGLNNGAAPAGLTFVSRSLPVGTKTDSYSADRATVEVWSDSIGGLAGQGSTQPVREYWFTLTLQLHWTGSDWKVADFSQKDGPAPVGADQTVAGPDAINQAVNQFGGFRYAR